MQRGKHEQIEYRQPIVNVIDKACELKIVQACRQLPEFVLVATLTNQNEMQFRALILREPGRFDDRALALMGMIQRTYVPYHGLACKPGPQFGRLLMALGQIRMRVSYNRATFARIVGLDLPANRLRYGDQRTGPSIYPVPQR